VGGLLCAVDPWGRANFLIRKIAKGFGIFFVALLTVMVVGASTRGADRTFRCGSY